MGEAAQPVKLTPAGQYLGADRNRARGGQVPASPRKRAAACCRAFIAGRLQPAEQARQPLTNLANCGLTNLTGLRQPGGGQGEILQPEDRSEQLIQARRAPEECLHLAVRKERTVVGERSGPPQAVDVRPLLPCHLHRHRSPGEVRARRPCPLRYGMAGALHQELRSDSRVVRVMHAAPAMPPDRRQLLPASQVPGKQHLKCFRKA